jgi:hypothetical protein
MQCITSNVFLVGMLGVLAAATAQLGPGAMFNLYFMPYWFFVMWLDVVTYLQHHGSHDPEEKIPWFRGKVRRCEKGQRAHQSSAHTHVVAAHTQAWQLMLALNLNGSWPKHFW